MTAPALIDQPARQRIATALGENLCVEAAAGTGKTTVLVDRVVNLLAHTDLTVDQLVVITFTEKAAAELATRVRDRLEDEAAQASGAVRDRLEAAARDLYRAHIETIHSFATALLRERPVEAELDPLFEVLEGLADSLDFDGAYERFQDELLAQPLPELERALRRGLGLRELREACQRLNEHRYLLELRPPAPLPDDVPRHSRRAARDRRRAERAAGPAQPARRRQGDPLDRGDRRVGDRARGARPAHPRADADRRLPEGVREQRNGRQLGRRQGADQGAARALLGTGHRRPVCVCDRMRCSACCRTSRSFVEGYEDAAPAGGPRRVRRPPVLGARPPANQRLRPATTSATASAPC